MKGTMKGILTFAVMGALLGAVASPASADSISFTDQVKFISDLQPTATVTLPAFDTLGNTLTLTNVLVEVFHFASVELKADNDDPFQGATVSGRMFRQWSLTGPGVVSSGSQITQTPFVNLLADDGDGGNTFNFDASAPDGVNFGLLSYGPLLASSHNPAFGPYTDTGTVDFFVTPLLMLQDLQFVTPPDAWQLDVQNPSLTVVVKVTYDYVPEPASLTFLALGAGAMLIRRRRPSR